MWLLLITGLLLGLTFPFGKLASKAGISPLIWSWLVSTGSAVGLLIMRAATRQLIRLRWQYLQYYVLSSIVSLVIPNILIFTVIRQLGAGFTGLLFTLSPVFTLALSIALSVRVPNRLGVIALIVGLVGAIVVALTRGEVHQPASLAWVAAGLVIPFSLALGNIYRTIAWPTDAEPLELAAGSNSAAGIVLLTIIWLHPDTNLPGGLLAVMPLATATVIASTCMFPFFFRLQQVGGPTYLSQIGFVASPVALFAGTVFLSERYSWVTWFGAVIIFVGIVLSVRSMRQT